MAVSGQQAQEGVHYEDNNQQEQETVQETGEEQYVITEGTAEQTEEPEKPVSRSNEHKGDRSGFVHGLAVGLGLGCIAAFVMLWIVVFFTPQLPSMLTYENLLSIFIYPLIYLLAVGLVALTAGIVREYFTCKGKY